MKYLLYIIFLLSLLPSCKVVKGYKFLNTIKKTRTETVSITKNIKIVNNLIYIPVKLDNYKYKDCLFIYDTGAAISVIDSTVAHDFQMKKVIEFKSQKIITIDSLLLFGKVKIEKPTFFSKNISNYREKENLCGILGTNINSLFYTKISYKDSIISLSTEPIDTTNKSITFVKNGYTKHTPQIYNIQVPLALSGKKFDFVFDTGYNGGVISNSDSSLIKHLTSQTKVKKYKYNVQLVNIYGKENKSKEINSAIIDFYLGNQEITSQEINTNIYTDKGKQFKPIGVIGYKILSKFDIYIDWKRQKIYLNQVSPFDHCYLPDIKIKKINEKYIVTALSLNSQWYNTNLKLGSEIISVDNQPINDNHFSIDFSKVKSIKSISPSGEEIIINSEKKD